MQTRSRGYDITEDDLRPLGKIYLAVVALGYVPILRVLGIAHALLRLLNDVPIVFQPQASANASRRPKLRPPRRMLSTTVSRHSSGTDAKRRYSSSTEVQARCRRRV